MSGGFYISSAHIFYYFMLSTVATRKIYFYPEVKGYCALLNKHEVTTRKLLMKTLGNELCGFLQLVKTAEGVRLLLDGKPLEEQLDVNRYDGEVVTLRIDVHDIDDEPSLFLAA